MTSFYLAGRYQRRLELAGYAAALERLGHKVTSRWLNGSHDSMTPWEASRDDLEDILAADAMISFTESLPEIKLNKTATNSGGRHVEFGIVLGYNATLFGKNAKKRKNVYIVGPRENVFHYLDAAVIKQYSSFFEFLTDMLDKINDAIKDSAFDFQTPRTFGPVFQYGNDGE